MTLRPYCLIAIVDINPQSIPIVHSALKTAHKAAWHDLYN